jgi:G6PDH family F420-dependent oxidoreductase
MADARPEPARMELGYGLAAEELAPAAMVKHAVTAEQAGFSSLLISDHIHPWIDRQGHSPFVWAVAGAIASATETIRFGTGVTCPILRMHPLLVAHAGGTCAQMSGGRFYLGLGTGERLNEHVLGQRWPAADERLAMLEEAIAVIRTMWQGGEQSFDGRYYRVENARIYDLPVEPAPIYVSAFGPKALEVAARCGDGLVTTSPDADVLRKFDEMAGSGKPTLAQLKVCFAENEADARRLAVEHWPTSGLAGELSQELATPAHFEQAVSVLHDEDIASKFVLGSDPERHLEAIDEYERAGFTLVHVNQVGPEQHEFLRFYEEEVLPRFHAREPVRAGV